jgi:endonuclease/exonuclease/phosphatase family metal-dependent hydrolase
MFLRPRRTALLSFMAPLLLAAAWLGPDGARGDDRQPNGEPAVNVMTFNIRYGTANDGPDAWPQRRELVFDVVRREECDFIGLQEALRFQIDEIRESVSGYSEIGVGRDDGQTRGEYSAILYRADRWKVDTNGTFWLSDTPDVIASKNWGNEITRIVTWGRFIEHKTGRALYVFNTHFDHQSQPSRVKSAELLARRIAERDPKDPVIVTGDFNAGEDNAAIQYLKGEQGDSPVKLVDTFRVLHAGATDVGTFNGFRGVTTGPKIDYIFTEPGTPVRAASILHDNRDGRNPSDHFPVTAEIVFSRAD